MRQNNVDKSTNGTRKNVTAAASAGQIPPRRYRDVTDRAFEAKLIVLRTEYERHKNEHRLTLDAAKVVVEPYSRSGQYIKLMANHAFSVPKSVGDRWDDAWRKDGIDVLTIAGPQTSGLKPIDRQRALIALFTIQDPVGFGLSVHIYWGMMEGLDRGEIAETISLAAAYGGIGVYAASMLRFAGTVNALSDYVDRNRNNPQAFSPELVSQHLREKFTLVGLEILKARVEVLEKEAAKRTESERRP